MIKGGQMKHINEFNIADYIVVGFSLLASGIGSFVRRDLSSFSIKRKLTMLALDLIGSVSIGITVFLLVYGWSENMILSAGIASAFGHIGTRGVYLMELMIADKLNSEAMRKAVEEYYNKEKNK